MRLKRLDVFGFKSFADRMEFDFEPGLTGLVGPNGCGKSNVIDAVRWVLGEQRAGALRGDEMADVLFKGTERRPPLGLAEVTIVFEDESGRLPEGRTEAAVTRRLFRTGESEYLLHGRSVRLKDVRDFLFDTGLGVRGYASMEQGKIDALLSADPVERRAVFEEAAGISRFRARRRETLRRIEQVEQDLLRIGDLLGELDHRVRSLKIQAGKARRYEEHVKALREGRIALALHRRGRSDETLAAARAALGDVEARLEAARSFRAEEEGEVRSRGEEAAAAAREVATLAAQIGRLRDEERACAERAAGERRRAGDATAAADAERERAATLEARLRELEAAAASLGAEAEAIEFRRRGAQAALADAEARLLATARRGRAAGEAASAAQQRLLDGMHERAAARNRLSESEGARRAASANLDRSRARERDLSAALAAAAEEGRGLEGAARDAQGRRREVGLSREAAVARVRALEAEILEREGGVRAAEADRAGRVARLETLRALEDAKEGLDAGTREILAANLPGVRGLLVDRLAPRSPLAAPLEAALGPLVRALVAERADAAAAALERLRASGAGRATLAVPEGVGSPPAPPQLRDPAVEGRLLDLLDADPAVVPFLEAVLGDCFVVRSFDEALRLAGLHAHLRFATPSGEIAGRGVVSGGAQSAGEILVRRAAREDLSRELADADARLEELRRAERDARSRLEFARSESEALVATAAEVDREATLLAARSEAGVRRRDDLERERTSLAEEIRAAAAEEESLASALEADARTVAACEAAIAALEREASAAEAERRAREEEREAASRVEAQARVAFAAEVEKAHGAAERSAGIEASIRSARAERARAGASIDAAAAAAAAASAESAGFEKRSEAARAARGDLEASSALCANREREAREREAEARARVEARTRELEELQGRLAEARLAEQRVTLEREESGRRLRDDYGVDLDALAEGFVADAAFDDDAAERSVAELRARIERFGPVNLEAVAELDESQARFASLSTQKTDLESARASLREAVATLDIESRSRFEETFGAVRENFQVVFRQLFRGGRADVTLEEGADVLEAGIEVVARPPGKELRSIELLSGGERTLTAIALLFALFRAKPSPFCLLDEVDAALDDANVERFLGLLREYAADTQFLLVTHNRRSMADCRMLYGVTMEENGVSKRVAVRLDEAEQYAREPAAERAVERTPAAPVAARSAAPAEVGAAET